MAPPLRVAASILDEIAAPSPNVLAMADGVLRKKGFAAHRMERDLPPELVLTWPWMANQRRLCCASA